MATFLQLLTEFYARGFDYLADDAAGITRAKAWVNQSYLELCEEEPWPFLLTTASGAAPLALTDIRSIHGVRDTVTNRVLHPADEDELADSFTLTTTGSPTFFYVDDTTVRTYPVGGTLSVRYWRVPAPLSADGDVAVVPDRFTNLIVDGAVRRAFVNVNAHTEAQAAEAERQRGLDLMRRSLLMRDGLRNYQRLVYASEDW
jgi:hypothetical protein